MSTTSENAWYQIRKEVSQRDELHHFPVRTVSASSLEISKQVDKLNNFNKQLGKTCTTYYAVPVVQRIELW